ncbi:MAG: DUF502 domain-containing protein [bacterium]
MNAIKSSIKKYLLIGVATFIPFYITIIVLLKIVRFFDNIINDVIKIFYLPPLLNKFLSYPGVGAFFSLLFLLLVGIVSHQYFGKAIMKLMEKIFTLFPISRQIYLAVKKMTDSFITKGESRYKRVVMVPFPHKGSHAIGFLTGEAGKTEEGEPLFYVYVPTAINPTSGFLISIKESEIVKSDLTVEEAFALILSGGMASANLSEKKTL